MLWASMPNVVTALSVFFPVYDEEAAVRGVVEQGLSTLQGLGLTDVEVIIVDDGSSDGTGRIADELAAEHQAVRVVHHSVNRGYGAALASGLTAATKPWVCFNDGDGQFKLSDLAEFLPHTSDYKVVLGYRMKRQDHFGRKFNTGLWALAVWAVLGLRVRDLDCGFKLIRRDCVQRILPLQSKGALISAELLLKLQRLGCRFYEVGVGHYPRQGGHPSGADLRVIMKALTELVTLRRRLRSFKPSA
jgi:glycosyltransferase involved in cell wall biosynthesis